MRVKGAESSTLQVEMDSPFIFIYSFVETFFSDVDDALPQLDWGLNGTEGGATIIPLLSLKGLDVMDESLPILILGWVSAPPVCPPNERCNPESMVGTMSPLVREPPSLPGWGASQLTT
ncbi:hypothetical protein YN1HA_5820 [Sulfurisphaera ohwakuensis]